MTSKTLKIAAAVAAVLAVGGIGATSYIGKKTEANYNGWVDKLLAEAPFLKVEKRSYERSLFGAQSNLVLRFEVPEPPASAGDDEDEADQAEADDESADEPADEADAQAESAPAAVPPRARPVPPRAIVLTLNDQIRHGPFPGSLVPAAARVASTAEVTVESADGTVSAPWQALTANSDFDFSGGYQTRYTSPAGEWKYEDAQTTLSWAGMEGEAKGRLENFSSRYTSSSPGLTLRGNDASGRPFELLMGQLKVVGASEPSSSLLTAPGEMKATLASLRFNAQAANGEKAEMTLSDLTGDYKVSRTGELMDTRSVLKGKGQFNETPIDSFEMVDHYSRIHAPTLEKFIRDVYAEMGQKQTPDDAQRLARWTEDLRPLLAHDPAYELEKFSVSIGGKQAELGYRVALKGARPEMLDNPMSLVAVMSAGLRADLPREWAEALSQGGVPGVGDTATVGGLLNQGVQMGFLVVDENRVSTQVRFENGELQVNGNSVFRMPPQR